jgi:glycosyltransferase involved in cell wall biosynthesis
MISILLATYNGSRYIKSSIDSILNQTFSNFELLIGLNGTTDNTKDLVREYNDDRIRIFDYGDDKGKSKTLNKLLKIAKYDLIALQDDDDIWVNNKLENQIKYIDSYDVIGTYISYIDSFGVYIGEPKLASNHNEIIELSFVGNNQVANTSAIFRKDDAMEVLGWREDLDGIEDYDFWLKLMRCGKKFINIEEKLVFHRIHNNSNFNTKTYEIKKIL